MTVDARAHMPQLDGLRFYAVLGVVVAHTWHPRGLPWVIQDLALEWAGLGVRLFFVLSGFLITRILVTAGSEATSSSRLFVLRQFYARRFLRIFPLYYLVIAIALLADVAPARDLWLWLITYTSNIHITATQTWPGPFGHFWTLAVEEQFYLLWPLLVLFAPGAWRTRLTVALILVAPMYRYVAYAAAPFDIGAMDFKAATFTAANLDTLGAGALLALLWDTEVASKRQWMLGRVFLPLGLAMYGLALLLYRYRIAPRMFFTLADTASAMVFVWLIARAAVGFRGIGGRLLDVPVLRYLGRISYGIYIFHNFTPSLLGAALAPLGVSYPAPGFLNFLCSGALTIAIAAASWRFLERPLNGLKRHVPYTPAPSPALATAGIAGLAPLARSASTRSPFEHV